MLIRDVLDEAPPCVAWFEFGTGNLAFEVELHMLSKPEFEAGLLQARKKVSERGPNGQRSVRTETDNDRLRTWLRDDVVRNWKGLTVGMALRMANRDTSALKADKLATALPAQTVDQSTGQTVRDNVLYMLREARGVATIEDEDGVEHQELTTFEAFVLAKATQLAEQAHAGEVREKNGSGITSAGSTAS